MSTDWSVVTADLLPGILPHAEPMPWDDVWMRVARDVSLRSKDPSTKVGAVIVTPSNRMLGIGLNGPPAQINDLLVPWTERRRDRFCKYDAVIHGDANAIFAALSAHGGDKLVGSTMYVTGHPCRSCMLLIIMAGIRRVVWDAGSSQPKMVDALERRICQDLIDAMKGCYVTRLEAYREGVSGGEVRAAVADAAAQGGAATPGA